MRAASLVMLVACGGGSGASATDEPGVRRDPWEDDALIEVGQDLDGVDLQDVQWFGYDSEGTRLAVIERREGIRPIGAALFAIGGELEVLVDSEILFEETGQDGIVDVRTDEDGGIGFTTAGASCWGLFNEAGLDTQCLDALTFDAGVAYLGPLVRSSRPVVVTSPDRRSYRIGAWDGRWSGWTEPPAPRAVGFWAFDDAERLWIGLDGVLERVTPGLREGVTTTEAAIETRDLTVGSRQLRGLVMTPQSELAFVASGIMVGGGPAPGSGIFVQEDAGPRRIVDLTAPIAGEASLAFLGRGGEPALTWAPGAEAGSAVVVAELDDGTTGAFVYDGTWRTLIQSGDPAMDRYGEPLDGVSLRAIGSGIAGPSDSIVVTAVLEGDGVTADNRYGVYLVDAAGAVTLIARTGERVPGTTELAERIVLHGEAIVFPDPRDEDPAKRRGVPDAGRDNDTSLLLWGARHWNQSIRVDGGCTSVLVGLTGEVDTALVERRVGDGC